MEKKKHIMSILQEMGYSPRYDDEGDVLLTYQMKAIYFMVREEEDDNFISVFMPHFASVEEGEESLALAVCNKMTRELKFTKVFLDQTYRAISSSCEFFFTCNEDLKNSIDKALSMLSIIRREYLNFKKDLTA